jgi:hypothetical protein
MALVFGEFSIVFVSLIGTLIISEPHENLKSYFLLKIAALRRVLV